MADRITLEFGPWEPDAALLGGQQAQEARNVLPAKRGYRPVRALNAMNAPALASRALDVFVGKGMDGTIATLAATASGIYELSSGAWAEMHSGTAISANRMFAQYGDGIYALYGNALLKQAGAGQNFAAVTAAPTGEILSVIRDFLVLGRAGGVQNCIRWSGIDRPDEWPAPGTNAAQYVQSDQQVFPEGGKVMAIAGAIGGVDGLVFLERGIQRMTYVGTPYIFQFDPLDRTYGTVASRSPVNFGSACVFLAEDGWRMTDGAGVKGIGVERVDAWFFGECDNARLEEVRGMHDAQNRLAVWSFPTDDAPAGVHDRLLIYSYALDRWSYAVVQTECLYQEYARGITLEDLDSYGTLDALPFASLDSAALKAGGRVLGAATTEHRLGTFSGGGTEAVIDTAEQGGDRMMVHGLRPLVNSAAAQAMPLWRDRQMDARQGGEYSEQERDGVCYQHLSCNYLAARVKVPAGEEWSHAVGVEALIEKEGGM